MQTRAELYEVLGYHEYERKLDELFAAMRAGIRTADCVAIDLPRRLQGHAR